jgi:hypothetical protein
MDGECLVGQMAWRFRATYVGKGVYGVLMVHVRNAHKTQRNDDDKVCQITYYLLLSIYVKPNRERLKRYAHSQTQTPILIPSPSPSPNPNPNPNSINIRAYISFNNNLNQRIQHVLPVRHIPLPPSTLPPRRLTIFLPFIF